MTLTAYSSSRVENAHARSHVFEPNYSRDCCMSSQDKAYREVPCETCGAAIGAACTRIDHRYSQVVHHMARRKAYDRYRKTRSRLDEYIDDYYAEFGHGFLA